MNVKFGIAVVLAVVIAAQPGLTLKCWVCRGFIEGSPEDNSNVKGCGDDHIPADSKIPTKEAGGDNWACTVISYQNEDWNNGTRLAWRSSMPKANDDQIKTVKKAFWTAIHQYNKNAKEDDLNVEQCQTDKCNGATGHAASTLAVAAAALLVLSRQ